jgi:hypothetical protein
VARPQKQTVDYFPHSCKHGKTMFILEQKYGNDGYAFWFKLLEMLGSSDGHYLKLENPADWEYLTAITRLEGETCEEILNLLAKLEAIDSEAWKKKIVWIDKFVENIKDAYRNRIAEIPGKPDCLRKKPTSKEVTEVGNTQSILDETILKEKDIVDVFHKYCTSLPKIKTITDKRKKTIRARLKQYPGMDTYEELFKKAEASKFLSGKNGKWTNCNFDWLLNETNMVKVLEGNYDEKGGTIDRRVIES